MLSNFDLNVYSEESFPVTENEYDEVMRLMAGEAEGFGGYVEWSDSRFCLGRDGQVHEVEEPESIGRIGGFEL